MWVSRSQHELEIFGRLFQRLEHGIECRVRQHMNLVNHEDLEASHHGLVNRLLKQLCNFIHAAVGGGVQLGVIHKAPAVNVSASLAYPAGRGSDAALPVDANAVKRLGQNSRDGCFTHTPRAGKQISMVQTLRGQRIAEGLNNMRLPDHLQKVFWAVFAGQD